ncbi:IS982 family transposase, partial [Anoxybacillus sp. LAT_11]|nr:IS982 family transposase [Anoxybacillus sp. LAT_11]
MSPTNILLTHAAIFCFVSAQLSLIQMDLHRRNRHLVKQEDEVV